MNNACIYLKKYRNISDTQLDKLSVICDRLSLMNGVLNLTALKSDEDIAMLHLYDSLTLLDTGLFCGKNVIDVGCGGGFPSLPLAACTDCTVTANDSTAKKLTFVSETAAVAGITTLTTLCGRAEELGRTNHREKYDICVSRGVTRMNKLVELCLPLVKKGGFFIAMKGPAGYEETNEASRGIERLGGRLQNILECPIPDTDRTHTLVIIKKVSPTPTEYPRLYAKIIKNPL